ncbi:hypothetical protein BKA69DRAFT_1098453 [Paraphysoderma sedebokerense]|nr:hypothetical protein BKA69DRAFT_1098453 [Paraphysoderma sedebokerense]
MYKTKTLFILGNLRVLAATASPAITAITANLAVTIRLVNPLHKHTVPWNLSMHVLIAQVISWKLHVSRLKTLTKRDIINVFVTTLEKLLFVTTTAPIWLLKLPPRKVKCRTYAEKLLPTTKWQTLLLVSLMAPLTMPSNQVVVLMSKLPVVRG